MTTIEADASPEKRLFISLITRDISLIDAFLDVIDNSINAALEPLADQLKTADDYQQVLGESRSKPKVTISITFNRTSILVTDNASGISSNAAKDDVFRFGPREHSGEVSDRLSVYGIGLKRAMFKFGDRIQIISDHQDGGFELDLNVPRWERLQQQRWTFEITPRSPTKKDRGTQIEVTKLHDDVVSRLQDGLFERQLIDRVARTYSFFIGRIVNIEINGNQIAKESFEIGSNYSSDKFKAGRVSCNITAGIALTEHGGTYKDRNSGWFIFCNGRAVLSADKSTLTGWGGGGLPIFQPKHRPFLGTVFFVSADPEALPWTTTKSSVNEESSVWQQARRHMVATGRVLTNFLDKRYSGEGTEIESAALGEATGKRTSIFSAATSENRTFKAPTKPPAKETRVQYTARVEDVRKIEAYIRKPNAGASEVGRHTFKYFLKNVIKDEE